MYAKKYWNIKRILILLFIFYFIINLIYPYNFLSINKSVRIDPNNSLVDHNMELISSMKKNNNLQVQEEIALELFDSKFTNQKNRISITKNDLNQLAFELADMREIFMTNILNNQMDAETIYYFNASIKLIVDLELQIQTILNRNFEDKWSIQRELKNIQNQLLQILDSYHDFKKWQVTPNKKGKST